jgi:hypothetical protein
VVGRVRVAGFGSTESSAQRPGQLTPAPLRRPGAAVRMLAPHACTWGSRVVGSEPSRGIIACWRSLRVACVRARWTRTQPSVGVPPETKLVWSQRPALRDLTEPEKELHPTDGSPRGTGEFRQDAIAHEFDDLAIVTFHHRGRGRLQGLHETERQGLVFRG